MTVVGQWWRLRLSRSPIRLDPTPFGATARDGGVNFSIYSSNAVSATLCLITLSDLHQAVISRGQFGVLKPDENCWPQMACRIPSCEDEASMLISCICSFN
ncbi:hypothetical protein LWI28_018671 [Acer negundo]|uniref:Uncharacterized protein n=1 Tax=Acer negundo TaxID=4023 RepID=A0AAD5J529_ACENE|nr:hypothetical protein LWI28_018671 [Acer negundo]KAK4848388.1 hypothetical protein QYF36_012336 [Acer negundo]